MRKLKKTIKKKKVNQNEKTKKKKKNRNQKSAKTFKSNFRRLPDNEIQFRDNFLFLTFQGESKFHTYNATQGQLRAAF